MSNLSTRNGIDSSRDLKGREPDPAPGSRKIGVGRDKKRKASYHVLI
jgi:hypothetical protein